MSVYISYPVSTRDSHISPRLPYQPETPVSARGPKARGLIRESRAVRESRVDTVYDMKTDIS